MEKAIDIWMKIRFYGDLISIAIGGIALVALLILVLWYKWYEKRS